MDGIDFTGRKDVARRILRHYGEVFLSSEYGSGADRHCDSDAWRRRFAKVGRNLQFSGPCAGIDIDRIDSGAADNGRSSSRFFFCHRLNFTGCNFVELCRAV